MASFHEVSVIGHELGGKFIQKTASLFLGYKKLVGSLSADKILSLPFTALQPVKILCVSKMLFIFMPNKCTRTTGITQSRLVEPKVAGLGREAGAVFYELTG